MTLERWTSIKSGLPTNDDLLLVVDGRKTVIGYYDAKANDGPVWRDYENYPLYNVTWWAPIPCPPDLFNKEKEQ
jgi:hypothetical protein